MTSDFWLRLAREARECLVRAAGAIEALRLETRARRPDDPTLVRDVAEAAHCLDSAMTNINPTLFEAEQAAKRA